MALAYENIMMTDSNTSAFISAHRNDDVRKLALSAPRDAGIDIPFALDQIAGWQTACRKLPSWAEVEGVIYPPHLSMEQCSSELTARYKSKLMESFINKGEGHLVDITGGFGVDFSFVAQGFRRCTYVEQQERLCEIVRHNLPLLGLPEAETVCGDGSEVIRGMQTDGELAIFVDPARRDVNGKRTFAIADCTPDILGFIDEMAKKASVVMIKLSPMLDWHATVADINAHISGGNGVREVHIISVGNECKELLIAVSTRYDSPLKVVCVNDNRDFAFLARDIQHESDSDPYDTASQNEANMQDIYPTPSSSVGSIDEASHLYVPNASVMKAGCFTLLSKRFALRKVGNNSHLFVGNQTVEGFPGKGYAISAVSTMNKKDLRSALSGIERANIATRNFPLSPEQLRKKLKLKDGGSTFLFATTDSAERHLMFVCSALEK